MLSYFLTHFDSDSKSAFILTFVPLYIMSFLCWLLLNILIVTCLVVFFMFLVLEFIELGCMEFMVFIRFGNFAH